MMEPERWREIERLYHLALEREEASGLRSSSGARAIGLVGLRRMQLARRL